MPRQAQVKSFDDVVAFLRQATADVNRRNSERMQPDGVSTEHIAELCRHNDQLCTETLAHLAHALLDEPTPFYQLH
jgi:hypothetical protein